MTTAPMSESIALTTSDGLTLQAERTVPQSPVAAAVICHPHPLYGGDMHNNVVDALYRRFDELGTACLRFNFRGVDGSEGTHGEGVAERLDIVSAIDAIAERAPGVPLILAGYSFGADVSLTVDDPRVAAWFAVAPPLGVVAIEEMVASADQRPKAIISGSNDDFRPADQVRKATADWTETTVSTADGANHFFAVGLDAVADAAAALTSELIS